MTLKNRWLWFLGLTFLAVTVVFAQTNTNSIPVPGVSLPQTVSQYWDLIIAAVTPLVVVGVKKFIPMVPKWVLPTSTPVIGILLGLAVNKLASAHLGWVDMAKAGALAVCIREIIDQAIIKNMASGSPPAPAPTPTK